jgi:hypothetical protein
MVLCLIFYEKDIFLAITNLGLNKALGPDGMTCLFHNSYWPTVKSSVICSVQLFFRGGFMLKEFNHTNIALIPKVDNPSVVNHLRPTSLTNFNYKIILKPCPIGSNLFLHKIVSHAQYVMSHITWVWKWGCAYMYIRTLLYTTRLKP